MKSEDLERLRAAKIVDAVMSLPIGGATAILPTPFQAGYQLACEEINHRLHTEDDEVKLKRYDDLVNLVEELHDEAMILRQAIRQTLYANGHLADGEICTLLALKVALREVGTPWDGNELPYV